MIEALADQFANRTIRDAMPKPGPDGMIPLWRVLASATIIEICILRLPVAVALKCFEVRMKAMA